MANNFKMPYVIKFEGLQIIDWKEGNLKLKSKNNSTENRLIISTKMEGGNEK